MNLISERAAVKTPGSLTAREIGVIGRLKQRRYHYLSSLGSFFIFRR